MPAPHEMPAIYPFREYVDSSGLINYGIPYPVPVSQMGMQAGKILTGATPADLPVQQSTRFELL